VQNLSQEQTFFDAEPAHDAEIDRYQPAFVVHEQIARMHVGVKKTIAQRMAQKRLNEGARQLRQIETFGLQPRPV